MMRIVTPIAACAAVTLFVGPALAREHSHHQRHAVTSKHFHHHSWRSYAHSHHRHHWRRHRLALVQPLYAQPANPFGWQQPAGRRQPAAQPAPFMAPVAQPSLGWAQPAWQQPGVPSAPRVARRVAVAREVGAQSQFASLVTAHARANGIPESLVHRVIMRESRYNPRAVSRGNYGIMQIRLGTARAMGYTGSAAGLLNPQTNMTYAVRYLAGAYRAAGGNANHAVAFYQRGYYGAAKRAGFSAYAMARPATRQPAAAAFATPVRLEVF